jgi:hypothetical protein
MTVAQGLTDIGTIAFVTTYAPNLETVAITGTATEGETLSLSIGQNYGAPTPTLTYSWRRCDAAGVLPGTEVATTATYELVVGDVGSTIRCVVTATNTEGADAETTVQTAVVIGA